MPRFPESWYSWRHQLKALAEAGFRAVALDMRGYGETDCPEEIEKYTLFHLVGDMVGVVSALGENKAVIVGHDWGAPVAWHAALFRPDVFRGVAGLSVPFRPRGSAKPTSVMPQTEEAQFYQLYFQAPVLVSDVPTVAAPAFKASRLVMSPIESSLVGPANFRSAAVRSGRHCRNQELAYSRPPPH